MLQFSQIINLFSQITEWKLYYDSGKGLCAASLKIPVQQQHCGDMGNYNFLLWHFLWFFSP